MTQNDYVRKGRKDKKAEAKRVSKVEAAPTSLLTTISIVSGLLAILLYIVNFISVGLDIKAKAAPTLFLSIPVTEAPIEVSTELPKLLVAGPLVFDKRPEGIQTGNDVKVVVQAWEGAVCTLEFYTADGNKSQAEGLGMTSPNSLNRCTWTWRINGNTHTGMGKIVVKVGDIEEEHALEILPGN